MYDVIIAGASFAGLAVARELRGNTLLIDKDEIGSHQTSACGTLVHTLENLGLGDLILQSFDPIYLNVLGRDIPLTFGYKFCTFHYREFCHAMLEAASVETVKAKVKDVGRNSVVTDRGAFEGRILVDATGWRQVLAPTGGRKFGTRTKARQKHGLNFGFETAQPMPFENLKFYWNPHALRKGLGWIFPARDETRFGVGSYTGQTKLKPHLEGLVAEFNLGIDGLHGGYFTHKLRKPTSGQIFLVGDSAGHCFPLTGEGIRPALYFGKKCGQIIQSVLDNRITLDAGLRTYEAFVGRHRRDYAALYRSQKAFSHMPPVLATALFGYLSRPRVLPRFAKRYFNMAVLEEL